MRTVPTTLNCGQIFTVRGRQVTPPDNHNTGDRAPLPAHHHSRVDFVNVAIPITAAAAEASGSKVERRARSSDIGGCRTARGALRPATQDRSSKAEKGMVPSDQYSARVAKQPDSQWPVGYQARRLAARRTQAALRTQVRTVQAANAASHPMPTFCVRPKMSPLGL